MSKAKELLEALSTIKTRPRAIKSSDIQVRDGFKFVDLKKNPLYKGKLTTSEMANLTQQDFDTLIIRGYGSNLHVGVGISDMFTLEQLNALADSEGFKAFKINTKSDIWDAIDSHMGRDNN